MMHSPRHAIQRYIALLLLSSCLTVAGSSWNVQRATFIPPACPVPKRDNGSSVPPVVVSSHAILPTARLSTQLMSKKKAVAAPVKKIQVKMLKYVEGTGHLGEVVMVTPAFFNNKLRPSSAAIVISDDQVALERAEAQRVEAETNAQAQALKERLDDLMLELHRKAGPDGQLFGGIGPKTIMEELHKVLADDFLHHKGVKVASMTNVDGSAMRGDIKHTGQFGATLSLTKDISASFTIKVDADS